MTVPDGDRFLRRPAPAPRSPWHPAVIGTALNLPRCTHALPEYQEDAGAKIDAAAPPAGETLPPRGEFGKFCEG